MKDDLRPHIPTYNVTPMKLIALLVTAYALAFSFAIAAELRRTPPIPNQPVRASLTNVQQAIYALVVLDVAVTLQAHPDHAETLAYRFRAIADVFRDMSSNGTFSVEHLRTSMSMENISEELAPARESFESVKTAMVTVYARCYAHRGRAGVLNLDYLAGISTTFSQAIREGIIRGGKANVME